MRKNRIIVAGPLQLSKEQIDNLIAGVKIGSRNPERDCVMLLLMLSHDLRVSEIRSLQLREIDLDAKHLHVSRVKGCDSLPHVLSEIEIRVMEIWLNRRAEMNVPRQVDTLLVSERRRPMSRGTVNLRINVAAKAAGLEYLSIHPEALRRSTHQFAP